MRDHRIHLIYIYIIDVLKLLDKEYLHSKKRGKKVFSHGGMEEGPGPEKEEEDGGWSGEKEKSQESIED